MLEFLWKYFWTMIFELLYFSNYTTLIYGGDWYWSTFKMGAPGTRRMSQILSYSSLYQNDPRKISSHYYFELLSHVFQIFFLNSISIVKKREHIYILFLQIRRTNMISNTQKRVLNYIDSPKKYRKRSEQVMCFVGNMSVLYA